MPPEPVEDAVERPAWRRALVPLAAGLIAVFLAASVVGLVGDLPAIDWRIRPGWIVLSLALFVLVQGMAGELWRRLLHDAGGTQVGALEGQRIFALGLLARYVPTQILMAVTRIRMCAVHGVPTAVTLASLAYEFVLAVGTSCTVGLGFVLTRSGLHDSPLRWLIVLAPIGSFVLLHPAIVDRVTAGLAAKLKTDPEHATIPLRRLALFWLGYASTFLLWGLALYAFARGISPVGELSWAVLTAYAVGYVAAILAFFVPGGLGARDAATASALSASMAFSVALAVSIGTRLLQTGVELGWAGVTSLLHRRRS